MNHSIEKNMPDGSANARLFLGIDTSCYTTSIACCSKNGVAADCRRLLPVKEGERGLRQSDAVFFHTKNLSEIVPELFERIDPSRISGIGVSVCPSGRENSYMPVFLVGKMLAESLAAALRVRLFKFTHQQGHIRAALFENEALKSKKHFAFHLSGGTSELVLVDGLSNIKKIGGSTDLNAGQLVDRLGVLMGLPFPAGKALEALAEGAGERGVLLPASVKGTEFSFSGALTKAERAVKDGESCEKTAYSVYDLIARTLAKTIVNAMSGAKDEPCGDFLLAGGVASSGLLKKLLLERTESSGARLFFARPELSSDNAVGAALCAMDEFYKAEG